MRQILQLFPDPSAVPGVDGSEISAEKEQDGARNGGVPQDWAPADVIWDCGHWDDKVLGSIPTHVVDVSITSDFSQTFERWPHFAYHPSTLQKHGLHSGGYRSTRKELERPNLRTTKRQKPELRSVLNPRYTSTLG